MLSYPQKYTLDVVPPEKIVWEEVEQAADSRENYEELLQHIDHAKPELLQQYDQWFSYRYPYQSETGKKSKYSVSELKHASLVLQYDRTEGEARSLIFFRKTEMCMFRTLQEKRTGSIRQLKT